MAAQLGPSRVPGNAQPAAFNRQIAIYLPNRVAGWSTGQIGRFNNGRDHSTVSYAVHRVEALREADPDVDVLIAALAHALRTEQEERNNSDRCAPPRKPSGRISCHVTLLDQLA